MMSQTPFDVVVVLLVYGAATLLVEQSGVVRIVEPTAGESRWQLDARLAAGSAVVTPGNWAFGTGGAPGCRVGRETFNRQAYAAPAGTKV